MASTASIASAQLVIYVDQNVANAGNGQNSWSNAYDSLDDALDPAINGALTQGAIVEIRIAQGTYIPSTQQLRFPAGASNVRSSSFVVTEEVERIIGGFAGTETDEIPTGAATILSGDLGTPGDPSDNCFHTMVLD